ncbi:UNVERIFIED_CONTAM: Malonyl-coenzyme:anthocyanin 5-O-glucoside-6'''-O-malonyltransferase [Sesamum radiatum]|uniref:Malonyl-coenzyme:anthocyanin 5-O-glucoside-6'''-O-malonyltransferase n=1 Tax=Sesamum radiatum TaxID=300843 RepID=A0AAW2U8V4_SESRA
MSTILERSHISPGPDSAPEFSLPVVFFDMLWYEFPANQSVLFFEFPCSKSHFLETIVPELKSSLSLTLTQFLPLAGNIIYPRKPGNKPVLRYETGNSVSFTVSESTADFNNLTGNHPGLCIGFVTDHVVADASTVVSFMQAWALINRSRRSGADNVRDLLTEGNLLPFYDRKSVTNLNGLDEIYCDVTVDSSCSAEPPSVKLPINKLRATFFERISFWQVSRSVICRLSSVHLYGSARQDCRKRLNPPLPVNYFGNCVSLVKAELKHGEVKGDEGFVKAAKAIGEAVKETVYNEKGILHGAEKWPDEYEKLVGKRQISVAGSPRFDFYAVDYGWGKPRKFEGLFIDGGGSISLCTSREFEGGLEIGLSKSMVQIDAFTSVFKEILESLLS